ncbi:MAG: flagellar biosynthetic protein FliO [Terriglobia bacterium]
MKFWIRITNLLCRKNFGAFLTFLACLAFQVGFANAASTEPKPPGESTSGETTLESHPPIPIEIPEGLREGNPGHEGASLSNESLWSGARALGATLLILGLILSGALLLKRNMPHRFGAFRARKIIQILETVALGDKQSVTLLKVGEEHLLVGSTQTQINLLKNVQIPMAESDVARTEIQAATRRSPLCYMKRRMAMRKPVLEEQNFAGIMASELANSSQPGLAGPEGALTRLSQLHKKLQDRS